LRNLLAALAFASACLTLQGQEFSLSSGVGTYSFDDTQSPPGGGPESVFDDWQFFPKGIIGGANQA
jgi:hypothetical protein